MIISKISVKSQTVIPREIRDRLGLKPGDRLRYRITEEGVVIDRAETADDPFVAFSEWASAEDDEAYRDL